jgi:ribosomal protein S18 acetylase RimI-like enzyme
MTLEIRPFTPDDYPALAEIHNATVPDHPASPEEIRFHEEHRDPRTRYARWLGWVGSVAVGTGHYGQAPWMFHPRRFYIEVGVRPEHRARGYGSALYDHVLAALAPLNPLSIRVDVRENDARALRFAEERGFKEDMRFWESWLDPTTFAGKQFADAVDKVLAQGIEITTVADLASDPDFERKLHELEMAINYDVPSPEPFTPISFEHYQERVLHHPNFLKEGWFIALDQGRYVGMSTLWPSDQSADLEIGLTGVLGDYRRRGIALALKLKATDYARQRGAPRIKTVNESNNQRMIALNERLGFVRQPAWITMVNLTGDEEESRIQNPESSRGTGH